MSKLIYKIVRHDGGWAYQANGTFSESFRTHDQALEAARRAAAEQSAPGESTSISWEDEKGKWHNEFAAGGDRPQTEVEG